MRQNGEPGILPRLTGRRRMMARSQRRRLQKSARASPAKTDGAFEYTALDAKGRDGKGSDRGRHAKHVRQLLRDKHLLPMEIRRRRRRN